MRVRAGRPPARPLRTECACVRDIQDTFLLPDRPECARIQGKIRTRRGSPEYPECSCIQDALLPRPAVLNARAFRIFRTDIYGLNVARLSWAHVRFGRSTCVLNACAPRAFRPDVSVVKGASTSPTSPGRLPVPDITCVTDGV